MYAWPLKHSNKRYHKTLEDIGRVKSKHRPNWNNPHDGEIKIKIEIQPHPVRGQDVVKIESEFVF